MTPTPLRSAAARARHLPPDALCVVALAAGALDPARLLGLARRDAVAFAPAHPDAWRVAGIDPVATLVGDSLAALGPDVRALAARVHVLSDARDLPVRLLGGQCFDPRRHPRDDEAWAGFPRAALWLPRFALASRRGESTLVAAFTAAELGDPDACEAAVHGLLDALSVAPLPRAPAAVSAAVGSRREWEALVVDALARMRGGHADKLVAARRATLSAARPWELARVFEALGGAAGPHGAAFAFAHDGAAFVGASPERLVSREGLEVRADALAGSVPARDQLRPEALLDSAKDRREHGLVVDGLRAALAPHCDAVEAPATPGLRSLPTVHHLWTPVRARLRADAPADVLALVAALHPTPALGGAPRGEALDWIAAREPAPRGWYAGPVGWCDARGSGDGEFFVGIRAAVLRGARAWLYAGAGLVEGSDPALEWAETEAKLSAVRAALERAA